MDSVRELTQIIGRVEKSRENHIGIAEIRVLFIRSPSGKLHVYLVTGLIIEVGERAPRTRLSRRNFDRGLQVCLGTFQQGLRLRRIWSEPQQPSPVSQISSKLQGVRILPVDLQGSIGMPQPDIDPVTSLDRVITRQARTTIGDYLPADH